MRVNTPKIPSNKFKDRLYDHIKFREGYEETVYLDTEGKPTCGIGHLLSMQEKEDFPVGTEIDPFKIKEWYMEDITAALAACNKQAVLLGIEDEEFKISLTSVNFQLGTKWYRKFPKAWKALCLKNYDEAIDQIVYRNKKENKYSLWYTQTPVRVKDFVNTIKRIKGMKWLTN